MRPGRQRGGQHPACALAVRAGFGGLGGNEAVERAGEAHPGRAAEGRGVELLFRHAVAAGDALAHQRVPARLHRLLGLQPAEQQTVLGTGERHVEQAVLLLGIGLGAALDYVEGVGRERIAAHEAELGAYAQERLSAVNSLRIYGTAPGKGAILSFDLEGIHAHDVSMVIDREGVAVRAGTHCAQPLLRRFGVTSTCRASFAMYNTMGEVDALAEALEKARRFFA